MRRFGKSQRTYDKSGQRFCPKGLKFRVNRSGAFGYIAGAEALARQYLMGKKYFRDKFDVDPKILFRSLENPWHL